MSASISLIRFRLDGKERTEEGRRAWALAELVKAGETGCTPIERPAPRWSSYVHKLKKAGLIIETVFEKHGGPFSGSHARYVLKSAIEVIEIGEAA